MQEDPGFYKNLLQELAQKERFSMPKYITISDGASHISTFSSKVEIKGETFSGESATTKKQAEMNAAKVAWCELKERKLETLFLPLFKLFNLITQTLFPFPRRKIFFEVYQYSHCLLRKLVACLVPNSHSYEIHAIILQTLLLRHSIANTYTNNRQLGKPIKPIKTINSRGSL